MALLSALGRARFAHTFVTSRDVTTNPSLKRSACTPTASAVRSPRKHRAPLVARNFKSSSSSGEEAPVAKPRPVRHPITEDPSSGAGPAETATQTVLFHTGAAGSAAVQVPLSPLQKAMGTAHQTLQLISRPRALLKFVARHAGTAAAFGVPLAVLLVSWQLGPQPVLQPLLDFWAFYNAALESHPTVTKIATGLVGCILGDYLSQRLQHNEQVKASRLRGEAAPSFVFDTQRTSRFLAYNLLVGTPVALTWFNVLDSNVTPGVIPGHMAPIAKTALDQLFMSPLSTAFFFFVMRCVEGHPGDAMSYVRAKLWPTLKANYCLWPAAHVFGFSFVPPEFRILYVNVVGLAWTVILTTIHNEREPPTQGKVAPGAAPGGGPSPVLRGGGSAAGGGPVPAGVPMEARKELR